MQVHPFVGKRLGRRAGLAGPADPGGVAAPHDRLHGCHQAARTASPGGFALVVDHSVEGEAVCGNYQVKRRCSEGHALSAPQRGLGSAYGDSSCFGLLSAICWRETKGRDYGRPMRISDVIRRKGDGVVTLRSDATVQHLLEILEK